MTNLRFASGSLLAAATLSSVALRSDRPLASHKSSLCQLSSGETLALVRVEQDTTHLVSIGKRDSNASFVTQMPAGRVRLLEVDSATRRILAGYGITARSPVAILRAAPYGDDCEDVPWPDALPFVVRGEIGYVRGQLALREGWINDVPIIHISDHWDYPYPRRRGLASFADDSTALASPTVMYNYSAAIELPEAKTLEGSIARDSARRKLAVAWARANVASAELEPLRTFIRQAALTGEWERLQRIRSRLRGTYRVDFEIAGDTTTWFFRTDDYPVYGEGLDSRRTTADILTSPLVSGYTLAGKPAATYDGLSAPPQRAAETKFVPFVRLYTTDRPTASNNDERRVLTGLLEFSLAATPEHIWDALEVLVPRMSANDSALFVLQKLPRGARKSQIPMTLRLDTRDGIRADTSLVVNGRILRVALERIDTISNLRPF